MVCACHGLEGYWQKDVRLTAGGWWECPVKRGEFNAARFGTDTIARIERNLKRNAADRRKRLDARRAVFANDLGG